MADRIQVQKATAAADDEPAELGREYNEKLQGLGRALVSSLYMLVRSAKMYDPDNAVFERPLQQLFETVNAILMRDGRLELVGVKNAFYLNGMLVRVDMGAIDNVRALLDELRARDIGGFTLSRSTTVAELQQLVRLFAKEPRPDGQGSEPPGARLVAMKVTKWSKLVQRLQTDRTDADARVDRKKYAMTCYARALVYVRKYLESLKSDRPLNTAGALRIVQDFIDVSEGHRSHFLGLSCTRVGEDYLAHHHVNTCLMSIVFGIELGLTKPQLRDLGYIALFHDAGMVQVDDEALLKRGALTPQEKSAIAKAPLVSVRSILKERSMSRSTMLRLVATFEHKAEFGTAVRDNAGNIQMIIPRAPLGLYSRIIAICATYDALCSKRPFRDAYGPEIALMLMWTELRHKFDPELLKVFMRVMAIAPVKLLTKRQQRLVIGSV